MANSIVLEELTKFIPYAVQNSSGPLQHQTAVLLSLFHAIEQFGSENWVEDFESTLIKMYMDGVKKHKTDKALCEYAKLIATANGVELPDSIKYFLILLNI